MDTKTLPEPELRVGDDVELAGDSPRMLALKAAITRLADAAAPVLVHGETGTGKERVARQLHRSSRRGDGPFVPASRSLRKSAEFFVAATITCAGVIPAATMSAISACGPHGVLPSVPRAMVTPAALSFAKFRA